MAAHLPHARTSTTGMPFPRLLGERLCLDFANSVEDPATAHRHDFLRGYRDLVGWGEHAGVVTGDVAAALLAEAKRHPDAASDVLTSALGLREAIDRVFHAIARGAPPDAGDLASLQRGYLAALGHAELAATASGIAWRWVESTPPPLERVLWPVVRSAIDLLLTGDPARIKECAPERGGCTWLFYDTSKNVSRRWCSMEGCGSQVKMRRYHARKRSQSG